MGSFACWLWCIQVGHCFMNFCISWETPGHQTDVWVCSRHVGYPDVLGVFCSGSGSYSVSETTMCFWHRIRSSQVMMSCLTFQYSLALLSCCVLEAIHHGSTELLVVIECLLVEICNTSHCGNELLSSGGLSLICCTSGRHGTMCQLCIVPFLVYGW